MRPRGGMLMAGIAAGFLLVACRAEAQDNARNPAVAEGLFNEGRAAANRGDFDSACKKFGESQRLDPAPGTVLNLAECNERQGHVAVAWRFFREVVDSLPTSDDRVEYAKQRVAALAPRLPRLTISLPPGAKQGTVVTRDGTELLAAELGTPVPVDPGEHVIVVTVPGMRDRQIAVTVREGEQRRFLAGAQPNRSAVGGLGHSLGYLIGGVGAVGILAGTITGALVLLDHKTAYANCPNGACNDTGWSAVNSGKSLGTVSGASFIVGVPLLAVGAYLLVSGDTAVAPVVEEKVAGLQMVGRW